MTTNKQDVRRYTDMGSETICPINNLRESDDGNYVLYEDYKALQAEQVPDAIQLLQRVAASATDKSADDNGTGNVLWSDTHSVDEILEEHSDNVLFAVVANLWADIRCLKEDKSAVAVPDDVKDALSRLDKTHYKQWGKESTTCGGYICGDVNTMHLVKIVEFVRKLASSPSHSQQQCNIGNAESHDKELQVTIEHNGKIFGVDESISEFVQLLNSVGLETVASCSGHGHRPANIALKDGREIIIARNYEEGREIDRIFPVDINGDRCPSHKSEQQIPECFKKLTRHAVGMCFGTDWNNGTAATIHRENLINSAWECDKYLSENSHESEQGGEV